MKVFGVVRWTTIDKIGNPIAGVDPGVEGSKTE
jgi:hypothetical protein